jgi:hypothetical protein
VLANYHPPHTKFCILFNIFSNLNFFFSSNILKSLEITSLCTNSYILNLLKTWIASTVKKAETTGCMWCASHKGKKTMRNWQVIVCRPIADLKGTSSQACNKKISCWTGNGLRIG